MISFEQAVPVIEIFVWICMVFLLGLLVLLMLVRSFKEDARRSGLNILDRFSSVIAVATAVLFSLLIFSISNRYLLVNVRGIVGDGVAFFVCLFCSLALGYAWANFAWARYRKYLGSYGGGRGDYYARNVLLFFVASTFFYLSLASPTLITAKVVEVREIILALFLGACWRLFLGNERVRSGKKWTWRGIFEFLR